MTEMNHNKQLSEVLSHAKCPRCNSSDKEAIPYVVDNYISSNIVGGNGLKAGVQVSPKKINRRVANVKPE
jgi:hypothetical protein